MSHTFLYWLPEQPFPVISQRIQGPGCKEDPVTSEQTLSSFWLCIHHSPEDTLLCMPLKI